MAAKHPAQTNAGDPPSMHLPRHAFRRGGKRAPDNATPVSPEDLARRMRRFAMFADLAPGSLASLAAGARVASFRAGEYLWRQGEPDRRVVFIEQGLAKTARRDAGGRSRTYGLHGPGDSMGIYALWAGMAYPTDAVALSDGMTALVIDSDTLLAVARRYRTVAARLTTEIGRFTQAFIDKIEIVSAGTVPRRLAVLMTLLLARFGHVEAGPEGYARLPIGLTLEHIGEIVDARIETVARALGAWKREGWLSVDADGCEFKRLDRLQELLADA